MKKILALASALLLMSIFVGSNALAAIKDDRSNDVLSRMPRDCSAISGELKRVPNARQVSSFVVDLSISERYLRNSETATRCLLTWLALWDSLENDRDKSKNRPYSDFFFQRLPRRSFEKRNPDDHRSWELDQLTAVLNALRFAGEQSFAGSQRGLRKLRTDHALAALNVLGWASRSSIKELRIGATLFLGNSIVSNGACAYFSHLTPLVFGYDESDAAGRANILGVGRVFVRRDRKDALTVETLGYLAAEVEANLKNSKLPVSSKLEESLNFITKSFRNEARLKRVDLDELPEVVPPECARYLERFL